jgi:exodeoxyribonuclease VII large subunit
MSGRLPFDPSRARGGDRGGVSAGDTPLTVSQLAARIDAALRSGLPAKVCVRGEVSGLRERTHLYFDLKDGDSVVNSVMFASAWRRAGVRLESGVEVVATGRVEFYAPGGKVSLVVERIEPVGRGALEARLRAFIEEIRALGWLDDERKRALPVFPRRVAVVTSRSGAALQDVIDTARRRCPAVALAVVDARVQGDGAAGEVAHAIRWLGRDHLRLGVDAILVTRGGGSMEDLWAFNERVVADAIVRCPIPVVAAIGHETDTTVAELVADARCATPTQAAMRLTPDREALERELSSVWRRASARVRDRIVGGARVVRGLGSRPALSDPRRIVSARRERLDARARRLGAAERARLGVERRQIDGLALRLERARPAAVHARRVTHIEELSARLGRVIKRAERSAWRELPRFGSALVAATRRQIDQEDERLAGLERELRAVGPRAVLARGFTVTTGADGRAVRSVRDVSTGEGIRTVVVDGSIASVVSGEGVPGGGDGAEAAPGKPPTRRRRSRRAGTRESRGQMDLFGGGG